jgi:hypothetical protein
VRIALPLVVLVLAGCGTRGREDASGAATLPREPEYERAAPDPWLLRTIDPRVEEPALLWNGLVGARIGRDGTGAGQPFFMIDEFDTEGEEKIRRLPSPLDVRWSTAGVPLAPAGEYEQTLDMRTGILRTQWTQTSNGRTLRVVLDTALHPERRIFAQKWQISGPVGTPLEMVSSWEGARIAPQESGGLNFSAWRATFGPSGAQAFVRHRVLEPTGGAWVTSTEGTTWRGEIVKEPLTLMRVASLGESPNRTAMRRARPGEDPRPVETEPPGTDREITYTEVAEASTAIWARRWQTDIEIDGPVEDQQAIRSFLFHLWGSIHPEGEMSVSPMGLSSTTYNGHVFWDADIWVFPALAFVAPERAAAIVEYRGRLLPAAWAEYAQWIAAGRPTGARPLGPPAPGEHPSGVNGAKFPWESSVSGLETVPGPSRYQDHISGSVSFTADRAAALGLFPPADAERIRNGVGWFFTSRRERTDRGWEIRGTMSPDEHRHAADNDLYTNLLAQWVANGGRWDGPGERYHLPRDETTFLTYDDDPLMGYKQAAAVLAIYPLQYPQAEAEARLMMERFEGRVTEHGPAMTDSVHATIWARLGESERAYEAWHKSWRPFVKEPHLMFSEKRHRPIAYFTTGAGGSLQTVIYGFLGFRIDSEPVPGAAWTKELIGENWLSIRPNLPPTWKSATLKNFAVRGARYTLSVTPDGATVRPGDPQP